MTSPRQALVGVRVVELASGVAGPFCARLFADYGAEVVKIEAPGSGDETRGWGPYPGDVPDPEQSGTFFFLNSNKQSVVLDLDTSADRARLLGWIDAADVFVSSHSVARLRQWGCDPESLAARHPGLVAISLTPFGLKGPLADWRGYDLNAYHFSACGTRYCGRTDGEPLEHGTFSADFFAGYAAAAWGLACLLGPPAFTGVVGDIGTWTEIVQPVPVNGDVRRTRFHCGGIDQVDPAPVLQPGGGDIVPALATIGSQKHPAIIGAGPDQPVSQGRRGDAEYRSIATRGGLVARRIGAVGCRGISISTTQVRTDGLPGLTAVN